MNSMKNLPIGTKIRRLTVISNVFKIGKISHVRCRCDCGIEILIKPSSIGVHKKSCGCIMKEVQKNNLDSRRTTHGMTGTPEYNIWQHIIKRCENARCKDYKNYGGRGIVICDSWRHSIESFLSDVGNRPSPAHSIERIDVNGNYELKNVKWASKIEQANNTRKNRHLTYNGETHTTAIWARLLNLNREIIKDRLRWGWTDAEALSTPVRCRMLDIEINGEIKTLSQWCALLNLALPTISNRVRRLGISHRDAILMSMPSKST